MPVPMAEGEIRTIHAIQLLPTSRGMELITASQDSDERGLSPYRMVLSAASLSAPAADKVRLFEIDLFLPSLSAWEVTAGNDGQLMVVYEFNGGAVNALLIKEAAGNKRSVSHRYPFNSFHHPHFIRYAGAARGDAVLASQDKKEIVLFTKDKDGQFGNFQVLVKGDDAILLEGDHGLLLLSKEATPGPSKFDRLPGALYFTRLTSDYQPEDSHPALPERLVIYDFDACIHNDEIYLLAVADSGVVFLKASLQEERMRFVPLVEVSGDRHFTHPSVACSGAAIYGALIENIQQDNAGIFFFKWPVDAGNR